MRSRATKLKSIREFWCCDMMNSNNSMFRGHRSTETTWFSKDYMSSLPVFSHFIIDYRTVQTTTMKSYLKINNSKASIAIDRIPLRIVCRGCTKNILVSPLFFEEFSLQETLKYQFQYRIYSKIVSEKNNNSIDCQRNNRNWVNHCIRCNGGDHLSLQPLSNRCFFQFTRIHQWFRIIWMRCLQIEMVCGPCYIDDNIRWIRCTLHTAIKPWIQLSIAEYDVRYGAESWYIMTVNISYGHPKALSLTQFCLRHTLYWPYSFAVSNQIHQRNDRYVVDHSILCLEICWTHHYCRIAIPHQNTPLDQWWYMYERNGNEWKFKQR